MMECPPPRIPLALRRAPPAPPMLELDRLTVGGFASIRALEDFRIGALNVLTGPNGGGKLNFIALFAMAAAFAGGHFQMFIAQHDGADAPLFGGRKAY